MGLLEFLHARKERPLPIPLDQVYDASIKDEPEDRMLVQNRRLADAIQEFQDHEDNPRPQEMFIFEEQRRLQPDYHVPYYWSASYHMKKRNYELAKDVLKAGITQCRGKSALCRRLAECYFCTGDLEQSIYWFCTAIMAGDQTDFNPYLFIGYMCDAYGLKKEAYWARRRARGISYTMSYAVLEYVHSDRDKIMDFATVKKTDKAVKMLQAFYLHASRVLGNL
jgi:hypothetical protein